MSRWSELEPPAPARVPDARPASVYGAALLLSVISVVLGSFVFSYGYLALNAPQWPPAEAAEPEWVLQALGLVAAAVATALASSSSRHASKEHRAPVLRVLVLTAVVGALATGALAWSLAELPMRPTVHAFGAIHFTLLLSATLLLAMATAVCAVVAGWTRWGHPETGTLDSTRIVGQMWWFAVITSAILVAVVQGGARWL